MHYYYLPGRGAHTHALPTGFPSHTMRSTPKVGSSMCLVQLSVRLLQNSPSPWDCKGCQYVCRGQMSAAFLRMHALADALACVLHRDTQHFLPVTDTTPHLRMICWLVISSHSISSACPHCAACAFVPSVRMGPGATVFTLRKPFGPQFARSACSLAVT